MSDMTYTHKDLASLLGVSETTVKSYRRKFPGCIPVSSNGKPIRFTAQAVNVATRIRDLFTVGMSVEEVRVRLAAEFDWIDPEPPSSADDAGSERGGGQGLMADSQALYQAAASATAPVSRSDVGPELSVGVSNMAKGMVVLTQQQKTILTRMQGLEALLEDLGLKGVDLDSVRGSLAEAAREREQVLQNRLDQLDATTRELSHMVHALAAELGAFFHAQAAHAPDTQSLPSDAPAPSLEGEQDASASFEEDSAADALAMEELPSGTKVIAFRSEPDPVCSEQGARALSQSFTVAQAEGAPAKNEPPRHLLMLPLVVCTEQGQYISAGGKNRGRFCVNDLKAILVYGFSPPDHFSLSWQAEDEGWRLSLEQQSTGRSIDMLLVELSVQGGMVAEVRKLRNDEQPLHPAEICALIGSLSA